MIFYRLTQDWNGLLEGSCLNENQFTSIYYLDKPMFEPIHEGELVDMLTYNDRRYCKEHGIELVAFYNDKELEKFQNKRFENAII